MLPAALRRWLHRPKRSDPRLLSQFFFADERVTRVVAEINGLDAELDPQQYLVLLNQLHVSQAQLLAVIEHIMEECIPTQRHSRDYLVKFPEELLVDNLGNHMLFAAECLLAGTFLEVEEADGAQLRPRARNLLCSLELVRALLREQSLSHPSTYPEPVRAALIQFDRLFAEFELSYVSSLVAVKSPDEIYRQQEIIVLFCETVERALRLGYLTQEMIDGYEPLLMFTIPRLAIISGLLIYPEGPLSLERSPEQMSRVFSPFYNLLMKISPQHPPGPRLEATLGSRRSELRSHYSSTKDMLHTLFVCISGVADQLQTNFASDLRSILKTVFKIVASPAETSEETGGSKDEDGELCAGDVPHVDDCPLCPSPRDATGLQRAAGAHRRPEWVPDSSSSHCSACRAPFTLLRRRHHCRSCGKIFCARCSPNTAALPHYGQPRPVRVCTHCHATHLPSWRSRTR
ncbi:lateral signaling target protein 2 homolog isoform X3 [Lagopus leucura]|uniref:lateral signaling target protein 2 homolog isoform X3 n=1 Tax=Lagopus leucura TaxID=30410 RepID=UPI001C66C3BE|nr:lateral signaling target protein 2 homolog isoform X3 [Lagopus leucura]